MSELSLVEKVELRIALADSDRQLENALNVYLPPVLLKLSSSNAQVRQAVLKIIQHVIPRINAARLIKLPIEALIEQVYNNQSTSVRLYSTLFISRGVERLNQDEKSQYILKIINGIHKYPREISARIFNILCKLLIDWIPPVKGTSQWDNYKISNDLDEKFLSLTIGKFLLLQPDSSSKVTPGLSLQDNKFFTTDAGVQYKTRDDITKVKKKLVEFIKCAFHDDQLLLPLLIASADPSSSINESSEISLRKLSHIQLDSTVIEFITELYVGENSLPVDSTLQVKILQMLIKNNVENLDIGKISTIALNSNNTKLKQMGIEFVKKFNDSNLEFNIDIAQQLRNGILSEGWPSMESSTHAKIKDRQSTYETLGVILKSHPTIFYQDWSFVEFLFESLNGETVDLRVSIQDALSGLTSHLINLSSEQKTSLKEMAKKYLQGKNSSTKYIIIKYINAAFPFHDSFARYLSVLGTLKENSPETIEEALNGLHPYWFNLYHVNATKEIKPTSYLLGQDTTVEFPTFNSYMETILEEDYVSKAVEFGEQVLVMEAVKGRATVIVPDQDWSIRLEKALEVNEQVKCLVIEHIKSVEKNVANLLSLCIDQPTPVTLTILSKLISLSSSNVIELLIPKVDDLVRILESVDDISLTQVSKSIGIIASHPSFINDDLLEELSQSKSKGKNLAACYIMSRKLLRGEQNSSSLLNSVLNTLIDLLNHSSTYDTALDGVSQLAMFGAIKDPSKFKEIIRPRVEKINEKSVLTLAYLTLSDEKSPNMSKDEQIIYDTHNSKQIEYIFTSSEALVIATAGWNSSLLQSDIPGETIQFGKIDRVSIILPYIFEACKSTKPTLRKAGCIWLLSFVQYCKKFPIIKEKATEIHHIFMRFLGDKDELVVESASRGLGLTYEIGDVELKDTLVKSLLKSFTSNRTFTSGTVEHDTQLFEPDVLKTNDGSVSTYKDVLNLAQDCGDPTLVYKFMNLAKSSSLWSSRKGIAFGLENILSQSSLDDLLIKDNKLSNKLIPKLFRYRYDPNLGVQQSMNDIWNSIIKDTSKAVQSNFNIILTELLSSMGKKDWRTRQASAAALNDLLQMIEFEVYEYNLNEIWTMSFRIMDDIKESVRREGIKLTKNLSINLLRVVEKNTSNEQALSFLIPFLLGSKGLLSDSQEVKEFALDTLMKLSKLKTQAIKAYIPQLIENFISLFSTLEPEIINYLYLNSNKYNLDNNDIDEKRLKSVGNSPLMDSIEKLLNQLDESNIDEFINRLEKSIKSSIGLPSKVSGSKVIVELVTNHNDLVKPYGDRLLDISVSEISDRNETIATSYAASSGYACRIATIDSIIKYSKRLITIYFNGKNISSAASEYVSRYCGERFESVATAFLPLAFIGKNDENKKVASNFEKEWIENTTGGVSSIRLYFDEIIDIISDHMGTNSFSIRKTLAKSLNEMSQRIDNVEFLNDETIERILNLLISSNKGKSWDGKELVFEALLSFSILAKPMIVKQPTIFQDLINTISVEIKRKNKTYQKSAILVVGKWLNIYKNEDILIQYIEIINNLINDVTDDDEDEEMNDLTVKQNIEFEESKLKLLNNLEVVFFTPVNDQLIRFIFNQIVNIYNLKNLNNTWRSRMKTIEVFNTVLDKLDGESVNDEVLVQVWKFLRDKCLLVDSIENVKVQFVRLSKKLDQYLVSVDKATTEINDSLLEFSHLEKSNVILTEINK